MRSISTDYSQNPQQKMSLSYICVFDCFESASRIANGERSLVNKLRQLKTTENVRKKLQSENIVS